MVVSYKSKKGDANSNSQLVHLPKNFLTEKGLRFNAMAQH